MELCFFNTVTTGMSNDGTKFTYVNQLASSDEDPSKRKDWFTCACCPPNVTRLLGYIGGYLWSYDADEAGKEIALNVHMYSSATLKVLLGVKVMEVKQESNWPWDGKVDFTASVPEGFSATVKLRIPRWQKNGRQANLYSDRLIRLTFHSFLQHSHLLASRKDTCCYHRPTSHNTAIFHLTFPSKRDSYPLIHTQIRTP